MTEVIIYTGLSFLLAAAIAALLPVRGNEDITSSFSHILIIIGCALLGGGAFLVLFYSPITMTLPFNLPFVPISLYTDSLSAYFLLITDVGSALIAIYSMSYMKNTPYNSRYSFLLSLLIISLNIVFMANNILVFIVGWELMAFSSYFLVIFYRNSSSYNKQDLLKAGLTYIIMTQTGAIILLSMFYILSSATHSISFADFENLKLDSLSASIVFLLALFGFGAKAGLFPQHSWLPAAHPVAPTPVSAFMSALMLNTAVYGFIRVMTFFGYIEWWWGLPVIALGLVTAVIGVYGGLRDNHLKAILAYSSLENMGLIFVCIGLGLLFMAFRLDLLAMLPILAALLWVLFHSLFKSLLFLTTANIYHITHSYDIRFLGGIKGIAPLVMVFFGIGLVNMATLYPMPSFISEWMLYQSILQSNAFPEQALRLATPFIAIVATLVSVIAFAIAVRLFISIFVRNDKEDTTLHYKGIPLSQKLSLFSIAALLSVFGLFPLLLIYLLQNTMNTIFNRSIFSLILPQIDGFTVLYNVSYLTFIPVLIFILFTIAVLRLARAKSRVAPVWNCGSNILPKESGITTSGITSFMEAMQPVDLLNKQVSVRKSSVTDLNSRFFVRSIDINYHQKDAYEQYKKLFKNIVNIWEYIRTNLLHPRNTSLSAYMGYTLIVMIILFIYFGIKK